MNTAQRAELITIFNRFRAANDELYELYQRIEDPLERIRLADMVRHNNEKMQWVIDLLSVNINQPAEGAKENV